MPMKPDPGPRIEISATPNPNAMKFTVDRVLVPSGSQSFSTRFEAVDNPLAEDLFAVPGVQSLFFMADFITVTKDPGAAWEGIVRAVESAIRDRLSES
jgi:NFU1 iron-sulfur cluster scaffold homolog, mitochondrial